MKNPHKCLNVLGNELRINIIELLKEKPRTVKELCSKLKKEQSLISHSLIQLKKCDFVDSKKIGKEREYYLKSNIFNQKGKTIFELINEHVEKYCRDKK
jgi:DNA-binding transcriptional ArsR family regulator